MTCDEAATFGKQYLPGHFKILRLPARVTTGLGSRPIPAPGQKARRLKGESVNRAEGRLLVPGGPLQLEEVRRHRFPVRRKPSIDSQMGLSETPSGAS